MTDKPTGMDPLMVDAKRLAQLLGISLRTVRTMHAGGRLPLGVKLGRLVRWRISEIESWIEAGAPDRLEWERRNRRRAI